MNEREIQKYLWENRERFEELIIEVDLPKKRVIDNVEKINPSDIIYNNIVEKITEFYSNVLMLDLFGCEVPLKKEGDSTIRADFLATMPERTGVTIVELKKSKQTERQAFTELLAYGGHIKTLFAPMSKTDVNYVLISPMQERIVREAALQAMIYDNIFVFALIPEYSANDISTLKLRPWVPKFEEVNQIINSIFSESNFDVYKVTWDALPGEWSPEKKGENPDNRMIERMNRVSAFAAQMMEERGIHGFVYTSQTHSELIDFGHLLNGIVVCGLNPYKVAKTRYFQLKCGASSEDSVAVNINYISMLDILPELERNSKKVNQENNYLSDLAYSWVNVLSEIAFDSVEFLTTSVSRKHIEKGWGEFTWDNYQTNTLEDINCHNFDMRTTGLIKQLFIEYSKLDFDLLIRKKGGHPVFEDGYIPKDIIDIVNNQEFVRYFIRRLFYTDI